MGLPLISCFPPGEGLGKYYINLEGILPKEDEK